MAVLISRNQVARMIYESTLYLLAVAEHQIDAELARACPDFEIPHAVIDGGKNEFGSNRV